MNSIDSTALKAEPAREPVAGEALFEDHFDAVYRYLSRRVAGREDAEDIAAETFAAAMTCRRPSRVPPRCWLFGIARRKLADAYRKRRVTARLDESLVDPANLDSALQMRQWIQALPQAQRDALLLQALEELSVQEIAQVMGRSQGSVKALLQRAKERIRLVCETEFNPDVKP